MGSLRISSRLGVASLLVAAAVSIGCGRTPAEPARPSRPLVLITLQGLRADAVGALSRGGGEAGATPNLDRFAAEADWVGRGVAASGWAAPAGASIFTGLPPWKHQVLLAETAHLEPRLLTLPEVLVNLGYHTSGYAGGTWLNATRGYRQGFEMLRPLRRRGRAARSQMVNLGGEPQLLWVHLPHPSPPWQRRDWLPPGEPATRDLPQQVRARDLAIYDPPSVNPSPQERYRLETLYLNNVAWADVHLGRFLAALRESGHWNDTLVVVTSTHGQELGEEGRVGEGASLARPLLEVPLVIKLPVGFDRPLAVPPEQRVATARLFATLIEAAGGTVPPGVAPSLFDPAASREILSELYGVGGCNAFSLLVGDEQLLWQSRFAPGADGAPARRLRTAFRTTLPLSGRPALGPPVLQLLHWTEQETVAIDDPGRRAQLAGELRRRWLLFVPEETTPARAAGELASGSG